MDAVVHDRTLSACIDGTWDGSLAIIPGSKIG
jgi:hypothetical protein